MSSLVNLRYRIRTVIFGDQEDWDIKDEHEYEPAFVADSNGFGYCSSRSTSAPRFGSLSLTLARDLTHIGLGIMTPLETIVYFWSIIDNGVCLAPMQPEKMIANHQWPIN